MCFTGNTFHCVVVARVISLWGRKVGLLRHVPTVKELWESAGYGSGWKTPGAPAARRDGCCVLNLDEGLRQSERDSVALALPPDPGIHRCAEDLCFAYHEEHGGDDSSIKAEADSESGGEGEGEEEETFYHLVQEEETIAEIQQLVLPPDEYYEELEKLMYK